MKTPIELQQDIEYLKSFLNTVHESCTWDASNHESISNMWMNSYNIVTELEAAQPKWISVEDELPEYGQLVAIHTGDVFIAKAGIWGQSFYINDAKRNPHWFWMPLPSPPKTTDNDNP